MKKILSKNDLLNCKYEGPMTGWTLEGEKLPDKIETEEGLLYYMMGQGYVILTVENGEIDWHNFIKLSDFLKQNNIEYKSKEIKKEVEQFKSEKAEDSKQLEDSRKEYRSKRVEIPFGHFQCWECGSIEQLSKKQDDGTCGCL